MVLADPSAIVRAGIKRILADVPEIHVIDECSDSKSAIASIAAHNPDIVIMDFHLASGTAVEILRTFRTTVPRPIGIVYTFDTDACTRAISYAAGADVFYDKSKDMTPLLTMLRKLAAALQQSQELAFR